MGQNQESIKFDQACAVCIQQCDNEGLKDGFRDPGFRERILQHIQTCDCTAVEAVNAITEQYIDVLLSVDDPKIKDGAIDIGLIRNHLRKALTDG